MTQRITTTDIMKLVQAAVHHARTHESACYDEDVPASRLRELDALADDAVEAVETAVETFTEQLIARANAAGRAAGSREASRALAEAMPDVRAALERELGYLRDRVHGVAETELEECVA